MEYQIYYGQGISYRSLKNQLISLSFSDVNIIMSGRQTLAKIQYHFGLRLFPVMPKFLVDHLGPFAQLFHVIAQKNP
jgi:hypothetical protein